MRVVGGRGGGEICLWQCQQRSCVGRMSCLGKYALNQVHITVCCGLLPLGRRECSLLLGWDLDIGREAGVVLISAKKDKEGREGGGDGRGLGGFKGRAWRGIELVVSRISP